MMKATNCPVEEARCAVKSLVEQSVRASNPLCAEKKKVEAAMLVVSDTTRPVSENRGPIPQVVAAEIKKATLEMLPSKIRAILQI